MVRNPALAGVSVTERDNGEKTFTFAITCEYVDSIETPEEQESQVQEGIDNYTGTAQVEAVEAETAQ